jgi:hypothetical protein
MHSPALALSWQLWARHRWGLVGVVLVLLTFAVIFNTSPAGTVEPMHGYLGSFLFVFALAYVASIFAYGFDSQLEASESCFPAWHFRLPISTRALVGWPMLQGITAIVCLWMAWATLVLRPCGIEVSWWLTALVPAGFLAVTQALIWWPFGLPWVRVVVAAPLLGLLAVAPAYGPVLGVPQTVLAGLFAALVPLAFVAAWTGVARARRGQTPEWQGLRRSFWTHLGRTASRQPPFRSAARAQLWFEWRRRALTFPLSVGCFAALHLALIVWVEPRPEDRIRLGLNFLFMPLLLAPIVGSALGIAGTSARDTLAMSAFLATRPMTSAGVVAAKLKAAALSTLAAWAIVLVAASIWLAHTGAYRVLAVVWSDLLDQHGAWRVGAGVLLAVVVPLLLTWKLAVNNLFLGLAGRAWVFWGSMVAQGAVFTLALMLLAHALSSGWLERLDFHQTLREALPWCAGTAVALKIVAAAWGLRALRRRELVDRHSLATCLGIWLVAALALFVLVWAVVPAHVGPWYLIVCGIVLFLPLVRLSAAPLALAWNRHR